jgi:hypothetical protein
MYTVTVSSIGVYTVAMDFTESLHLEAQKRQVQQDHDEYCTCGAETRIIEFDCGCDLLGMGTVLELSDNDEVKCPRCGARGEFIE